MTPTDVIADWLSDQRDENTEPEDHERARDLLARLAAADFELTAVSSVQDVLDCPITDEDSGVNGTVQDYLIHLLEALWVEREGFDGKRPFGNSSWAYDVYKALGAAGIITCELDEDGYVDSVDRETGDRLVLDAIRALGR